MKPKKILNKPYAELKRTYYPKQTNGVFTLYDAAFQGYTLERPWVNNEPNISCIPEDIYFVKPDNTGKFQWFEITHVPNRSNIEMHGANKVQHLQGCIGLGIEKMDMDGDGLDDIRNCKPILDKLRELCPKGFYLKIYS